MKILKNSKNIVIIIKYDEVWREEIIFPEPTIIDNCRGHIFQEPATHQIITLKTGEKFSFPLQIIKKVKNIADAIKNYL